MNPYKKFSYKQIEWMEPTQNRQQYRESPTCENQNQAEIGAADIWLSPLLAQKQISNMHRGCSCCEHASCKHI